MGSRLMLALVLAACSRTVQAPAAAPPPPAPEARAQEGQAALREQARSLLERHCGECHVGTRPTARPAALAVFNLVEADWSARMSARQLGSLERRIASRRHPTKAGTPQLTGLEWSHLQAYVAQEQARRAASARGAILP